MEQLLSLDQQLLLAINGWHAAWADTFFWYVSAKWVWIPLYLVLAFLIGEAVWMEANTRHIGRFCGGSRLERLYHIGGDEALFCPLATLSRSADMPMGAYSE